MKKTTILALAAFMFCSAVSADAANKTVKRNPVKDWTLAVFINADNNLDRFGAQDQEEMSKIGSNEDLNIVTLIDREQGPAQINYIENYKINKIKDMGELDMGDYKEFVKFVKFVKENYPANHYAIGFWNHGSGWKKKDENDVVRGISYDDSSRNHITTNDLTVAMKEVNQILGKKVDLLFFDACLMQMVEVAYAVKDSADYMLASEETEPGKGAPYDDILKTWKKGITAKQFGINWVNAFADSYNGGSQGRAGSTQSLIDLSKFPKFVDAINGLAKAGLNRDYSTLFKNVFKFTQRYAYPENMDLLHFAEIMRVDTGYAPIEQLKTQYIDASLKTALDKLDAAGKELIVANRTTTDKLKESKGIAIYFSDSWYAPWLYQDLAFAKETLWDDMLVAQGEFAEITKVVSEAKEGKFGSLGQVISKAKKDPKNKVYRRILNQLNFIAETERSVPAKSQAEFDRYREKLKAAIAAN